MAELKKTVAEVKPVASIKTPVVAEEKKVDAPKAVAKKPAAKKPAVKKATVAPAKKAPTKKAEPKKAVAKKAPTKKAPAKKTAAKKPAAKKTEAVAAVKTNIVLQYADKNVTYDTLVENAENVYQYDMGKNVSDIKKLDLYVKPEENTVYFVVNDKEHNQYGL